MAFEMKHGSNDDISESFLGVHACCFAIPFRRKSWTEGLQDTLPWFCCVLGPLAGIGAAVCVMVFAFFVATHAGRLLGSTDVRPRYCRKKALLPLLESDDMFHSVISLPNVVFLPESGEMSRARLDSGQRERERTGNVGSPTVRIATINQ